MSKRQKLNRREFLRLSAYTAATATLVACGGDGEPQAPETEAPPEEAGATPPPAEEAGASPAAEEGTGVESGGVATPVQAPGSYAQAPMFDEQGDLPPVEERLPTNPYVPPHPWLQVGQYGGTLRTSSSDTWGIAHYIQESQYGHSLLRWLDDGQAIGPGLVESWESNDDASEWTLHFREGLKWSDGEPWTTASIMFWWEDMVLNEEHSDQPPDESRSGTGTLMEMTAPDDVTIVMTFDAPAPLTADRLAMWVNAGIGPRWMAPRHYLEQFHPTYNEELSDYTELDEKIDWPTNPECPTMTGWMPVEYEDGVRSVWERNPYYWCVDAEGNQLPYIDRIEVTGVQDPEVQKLGFLEGQVDWAHFHGLTLADVSALRQSQERSGIEVRFWDSGSGTGSIFFFNYDFRDEKMRELIRTPQFRQALSHAFNREEVQKVIYFNTGELTTGTLSPKAIEYNVNEQGQQAYAEWRDSYVQYDPDRAQQILDEIGVEAGAGGNRTMPDGSPLTVRLDIQADAGQEHLQKNERLAADWKAIGINAQINPVPPAGLQEAWLAGELMSKTAWEVGDGPNHLVFASWLVPDEPERWAPLQGNYYRVRGTPDEGQQEDIEPWERNPPRMAAEEGGPVERLWALYDESKVEPDPMRRHQLVWDMIKIHVEEGPFFMGSVANYPRIILVRQGLLNVPQRDDLALGGFVNPWIIPAPAVYDPETWYWDDPAAHS